jgi:ribosome-binding factor A
VNQRNSGRMGQRRKFPRTVRINESLREVIAEELERIGDDRLEMVTITGITADPDLRTATVWFSSLALNASPEVIGSALSEFRVDLQKAIGRQLSFKRTPLLHFELDPAIINGQKIESILRDLPRPIERVEDAVETEPSEGLESAVGTRVEPKHPNDLVGE